MSFLRILSVVVSLFCILGAYAIVYALATTDYPQMLGGIVCVTLLLVASFLAFKFFVEGPE
jgi:hypothetical protein